MFSFSLTPGLAMKMAGACLWEAVKAPVHIIKCIIGAICFVVLAVCMVVEN